MQPINPNGNVGHTPPVVHQAQATVGQQQAPAVHPHTPDAPLLAALGNLPVPPEDYNGTLLMWTAERGRATALAALINAAAHVPADQPQDP